MEYKESVYGPQDSTVDDTIKQIKSRKKRTRAPEDDDDTKEAKVPKRGRAQPLEFSLQDYSDEVKVRKLTIPQLKTYLKVILNFFFF
jgi:hypothetical protein